ncbi:MAG: polysaccharide biosynthesis protein [Anaerosporomusa subterranea]|jgi:stage V sporulation protein B|nr:polysaccharide biosynthesis protein [Anaerosporomusa subterranea]
MDEQKEPKKQTRSFLKGALILSIAGFFVKGIGFLNWIILSRVLGAEGIGLYQMAYPVYLLALSLSSAGLPVAISIITAEKLARGDYRGAGRVFQVSLSVLTLTGFLLSLAVWTGADSLIELKLIRDPRAYYSILALAPAIFFVTLLSSFRGYLQGWQRMTPTAVSQVVEQLLRVATMLIFASMLLPKGLEYAAAGATFGAAPGAAAGLMVLIYYYWQVRTEAKAKIAAQPKEIQQEPIWTIVRRLVLLALPVSVSDLMLPVVSNLDLLIVPGRLEDAGYSVSQATELFGHLTGMAVPLVNLTTILTAAMATSLVPAISAAYAVGDTQGVKSRIATAVRISHMVTLPAFAVLLTLAAPIADMVYHAPQAGRPLEIMAVSVFLLGLHQVTTGVLQGMGHTTVPLVNMGLSALAKVILNWLLVGLPALGIAGAALATVADIGLAAVLNLYFLHRYSGFHLAIGELWRPALAATAMGVVMYGMYGEAARLAGNNFATIASFAVGVVVYTGVLIIAGGLQQDDLEQVPMIGRPMLRGLRRMGFFPSK